MSVCHLLILQFLVQCSASSEGGKFAYTDRYSYSFRLDRLEKDTHIILQIKKLAMLCPLINACAEACSSHVRVQIIKTHSVLCQWTPTHHPHCAHTHTHFPPSVPFLSFLSSIPSCLSFLLNMQGSFVDFQSSNLASARGRDK